MFFILTVKFQKKALLQFSNLYSCYSTLWAICTGFFSHLQRPWKQVVQSFKEYENYILTNTYNI